MMWEGVEKRHMTGAKVHGVTRRRRRRLTAGFYKKTRETGENDLEGEKLFTERWFVHLLVFKVEKHHSQKKSIKQHYFGLEAQ